jgi:DNA-binding XRE family transcriptional regulator
MGSISASGCAPPTYPAAERQLKALGDRLRAARLRRRLTQEVVAARVGVSKQTLAKLESGLPTTSLATKSARGTGAATTTERSTTPPRESH